MIDIPYLDPVDIDIILRLLTALGCGAVIGLNREAHRKPAGFRTFGLVSVGSALVVIVMELEPDTNADAVSRVIQGVLTGIGFIGAGVIFRRESPNRIAGLTTAAAVWLTAGLGMAAGAGQYTVALTGMVIGILLLLLGKPLERAIIGRKKVDVAHRKRESHPGPGSGPGSGPGAGQSQD